MKLTDSQLIVLSAASRHPQLSVLPLAAKRAANADKILPPLLKKKLIAEQQVAEGPDAIPVHRTDKRGRQFGLVISPAGLQALGAEPESGATGSDGGDGGDAGVATATGAAEADAVTVAAAVSTTTSGTKRMRRPKASRAKPASKGKAARRAADAALPREGTKLAALIVLLRRKHGATVDQIAKALGWQRHTVRGAIAGALKSKLGLKVTSEKTDGTRVYRLVD